MFTYEYALLRVVPRVERGECMNAGVVVWCRAAEHLGAAVSLDRERLLALDPRADAGAVEAALHSVLAVCAGGAGAPGTPAPGPRFRWLTAPRSTIVQPGPVHTGLSADPTAEPGRLLRTLVHPPADDAHRAGPGSARP